MERTLWESVRKLQQKVFTIKQVEIIYVQSAAELIFKAVVNFSNMKARER